MSKQHIQRKPHEIDQPKPVRRGYKKNRRAAPRPWPVPLTVLAELLYRDTCTPYRAAERFGLQVWVRAQVREFLTKGGFHCQELDLERAIRFNAALLEKRARFVLLRRDAHLSRQVDGVQLAQVVDVYGTWTSDDSLVVWKTFIDRVADELVDASRSGHVEDTSWASAERYLDQHVAPRIRQLRHADPDAERPRPFMRGGYRRMARVLDGLTSSDPETVQKTLKSWDCARLTAPELPDPTGWEDHVHDLDATWSDEPLETLPFSVAVASPSAQALRARLTQESRKQPVVRVKKAS